MDLRQLEYFLAVVDHGGVTRAAEALRVAQPSLSQSVRRLENDLGTSLFHRVGRGLVLAPAGEALVGPARTILREVDRARDAVGEVAGVRGGRVDVAALTDMSADPLAVWVAAFRSHRPAVGFRIEERDDVADVVSLVRSGECELGLLATPVPHGELVVDDLGPQHFVLLAPPGSESWPDPVPVGMLRDAPFVMGSPGTASRDLVEDWLRGHGLHPRVSIEVPQSGAVIPIVLAGGGVGIVPLRVAAAAHLRGAVVRELEPGLSRSIALLRRPGAMTSVATLFEEYVAARLGVYRGFMRERMERGMTLVTAAVEATDSADLDPVFPGDS